MQPYTFLVVCINILFMCSYGSHISTLHLINCLLCLCIIWPVRLLLDDSSGKQSPIFELKNWCHISKVTVHNHRSSISPTETLSLLLSTLIFCTPNHIKTCTHNKGLWLACPSPPKIYSRRVFCSMQWYGIYCLVDGVLSLHTPILYKR